MNWLMSSKDHRRMVGLMKGPIMAVEEQTKEGNGDLWEFSSFSPGIAGAKGEDESLVGVI